MGPIAARKLERIVENASNVLAIEAMAAARALDLRGPKTTKRLQAVHAVVRSYVAPHDGDRALSGEIEALAGAIRRGELRRAAELPAELE